MTSANGGNAKAYQAMSDKVGTYLWEVYSTLPSPTSLCQNRSIYTTADPSHDSEEGFLIDFTCTLRDFHTAGIVSSHSGTPFCQMVNMSRQQGIDDYSISLDSNQVSNTNEQLEYVYERLL